MDELRAEDLHFVGDHGLAADVHEFEHAGRVIEPDGRTLEERAPP